MDALLNRLVLGGVAELQSRCPEGGSFEQCWGLGIALPAFGGTLDEGEAMLDGLQRLGVEVSHVRSVVGCAGRLNQDFARGMSKLMFDLRYFEDLLRDARAASGESLDAWCGMVGGIRKYGARFAADLGEPMVLEERKGLSAYALPEIGHVRFEVKADAKHLPVALASMFGKYVRELWMLRINEFYRKQLPALRACSGYHDSVSKRFVTETEALRLKLGIVNTCFERNR